MQESWCFGRQEEEACPRGEARRRDGDQFKGFALGGDAASGRRGGTIATGQKCGLVLPTDDDKDDDFQVTFSFGLWCHCTDSSCGLCTGSANSHKRPWQGQGSSKLKLMPPPTLAAPSSQPAARATLRPVPENRRSSTQPVSGRATKKSVHLYCLAELRVS
jgi:hypothetical protein